jgi:Sel1 repeat
MKKGGAAKGELVLAIFELANCFRNGWGVQVDKAAARQYYETAANLGDTDAMNEAAWCYLEGFGGKKDKVSEEGLRSSLAARLSGLSCTGIHLAAKMPGTIVALFVSRRRTDPW